MKREGSVPADGLKIRTKVLDPSIMDAITWTALTSPDMTIRDQVQEIVHRLPEDHRFVLSGLYLETSLTAKRGPTFRPGRSVRALARELQVSRFTLRQYEDEALIMFKLAWEGKQMATGQCAYEHDGQRCQQEADDPLAWCNFHWRRMALQEEGHEPRLDPYYHDKILRGEIVPTWDYLTDDEARWVTWGKRSRSPRREHYDVD